LKSIKIHLAIAFIRNKIHLSLFVDGSSEIFPFPVGIFLILPSLWIIGLNIWIERPFIPSPGCKIVTFPRIDEVQLPGNRVRKQVVDRIEIMAKNTNGGPAAYVYFIGTYPVITIGSKIDPLTVPAPGRNPVSRLMKSQLLHLSSFQW